MQPIRKPNTLAEAAASVLFSEGKSSPTKELRKWIKDALDHLDNYDDDKDDYREDARAEVISDLAHSLELAKKLSK